MAIPDEGLVVVDVAALHHPDVATLDALARLQLAARRCGYRVQFRRACADLRDLMALAGLDDVLPLCPDSGSPDSDRPDSGSPDSGSPDSGVQGRGQPEQPEQAGVEEARDPGDPPG